jgi:hypothetical protein
VCSRLMKGCKRGHDDRALLYAIDVHPAPSAQRDLYSLIFRICTRSSRRCWNHDEAEDMGTTPCNIRNSPKVISAQPFSQPQILSNLIRG